MFLRRVPRREPRLAFLLAAATFAFAASADRVTGTWPFEDGSLVVSQDEAELRFDFAIAPFLDTSPAWVPAYPRAHGQMAEEVRPLQGLAGGLHVGTVDSSDVFTPFSEREFSSQGRSPYSASYSISSERFDGSLAWSTGMDHPGMVFEVCNSGGADVRFGLELRTIPFRTLWATPGKKEKRDWGAPRHVWKSEERVLLQSQGNPLDATRSFVSALWFGETTPDWKGRDLEAVQEGTVWRVGVSIPSGQTIRFGFLHSDNEEILQAELGELRGEKIDLSGFSTKWSAWVTERVREISARIALDPDSLSPQERKVLEDNLIQTRLLFLSNGGLLSRAMTLAEFPLDLRDQSIALRHWFDLGLKYPNLARWAELTRHNRVIQRSIPIPLFSEGRLKDLLAQGEIILTAPDPEMPPSRKSFDALLGYVFAGGKVTLVDGVEGFRGREGWWTEAGAADPADYALQMFKIPVEPGSRQTLDEEGLSPEVNTFGIGFQPLGNGKTTGIQRVTIQLPEASGALLLHPKREDGPGIRLHSVRLGKTSFHPLSLEAEPMVAGEHGGRVAFSSIGEPMAWELLGESYVAYRVPEGATSVCELELEGEWAAAWGKEPPVETLTLRKKAFQSWFQKELLTVEIPRIAHPTVYSGTYTCRVFDVTGTPASPVWFQKIGKGSFAWVGLPLDWVLRGSDTGADGQNPLRNDPGFDLIRLTLALHDSRRAGGGRASREPLAGWGSKWSASLPGDPRPDLAYFAFFPMERLNPWRSIGGGWPFDRAMDAIEHAKASGMILPGSPVALVIDRSGQKRVDLYTNCSLYALLHRIEEIAAREGQGALQMHAARERKRLLASLVEILEVTTEQPVPARFLLNDAPASAAAIAETLPEIAWTVSEIPPQDYPGGASARARLLSLLLSEQAALSDSRSLAALATVSEERRAELVESLLSRAGAGDLALIGDQEASFDLATAIPGLHALCLSKRRS